MTREIRNSHGLPIGSTLDWTFWLFVIAGVLATGVVIGAIKFGGR